MSPAPQPYRRSQNRLRLFVCLLAGFISVSTRPFAQTKSGKQAPKPPVEHAVNILDAAILWHKYSGSEIPEEDVLRLYDLSRGDYNEFVWRQKIRETQAKFVSRQAIISKVSTFTVVVEKELGEYNFSEHFFPTGLSAGPLRVNIGVGGDIKATARVIFYYVRLEIPEDLATISMSEGEAEGLSARFQPRNGWPQSRKMEVKFLFSPESALEELNEYGDLLRTIHGRLVKAEISLQKQEDTVGGIFGPPKAIKIYPRKVLKVWEAPK